MQSVFSMDRMGASAGDEMEEKATNLAIMARVVAHFL
jgi:hypothetical protein